MKFLRTFFCACLLFITMPLFSAITLNDVVGRWQNDSYMFIFGRNYTASVIIYINSFESYVFSGIYTIENKDVLRINISEMKSVPRSEVFSKKGFTKTASSRFLFTASLSN
ncbi:MAG TPA: hypothetical protein VF857_00460, partial [Spirochaetota bacterium]